MRSGKGASMKAYERVLRPQIQSRALILTVFVITTLSALHAEGRHRIHSNTSAQGQRQSSINLASRGIAYSSVASLHRRTGAGKASIIGFTSHSSGMMTPLSLSLLRKHGARKLGAFFLRPKALVQKHVEGALHIWAFLRAFFSYLFFCS